MVDLTAHPLTPCAAVRSVRAGVTRAAPEALTARYRIEGALERLRIPPPRTSVPGERLWRHTCCELFIGPSGEAAYREFNFSPSTQWAAYAFARYREGAPLAAPDPAISVHRSEEFLELEATVTAAPVRLRVALCVVIEDAEGALSYWALAHPAGKPDFHHREAFALELD